MIKIDIKDRKILYHLHIDSRQSFRSMGKKIGLSKDVVTNRVKKLQENGVIKFFHTDIDEYKLGFSQLRFYFTYENVSPEIKKEIIDNFVKYKHTRTVSSNQGNNNLGVVLAIKNISNFYNKWGEKFLNKYKDYFSKHVFSIVTLIKWYNHDYLLEDNERNEINRLKLDLDGSTNIEVIDDFDFRFIQLIARDARMPTVEIAEKMDSTSQTINNRLISLKNKGIIKGYSIIIDFEKLGYKWFKVDVILKDVKKLPILIKYLEKNPNFIQLQKAIGYVDVEFAFVLKDANQLLKIMEDLSYKFPNTIKKYTYFYMVESHRWDSKIERN